MKSFLEEYGFAILAAIVVILLIAMCTPVGNLIRNQVMGVVESFAGRTESKLANIDDGDVQQYAVVNDAKNGVIVEIIKVPSKTNQYEIRWNVNGQGWDKDNKADTAWNSFTLVSGGYKGATATQAAALHERVEYEIRDIGTKQVVAQGSIEVE